MNEPTKNMAEWARELEIKLALANEEIENLMADLSETKQARLQFKEAWEACCKLLKKTEGHNS